jgi:ATP-dependent RNA helicase DDX3X
MAYVQTDSGKTTTFYFPITGIIMQPTRMQQRGGSMGMRTAYPSALILPPRESSPCRSFSRLIACFYISCFFLSFYIVLEDALKVPCMWWLVGNITLFFFTLQIHEEARKLSYQTGVRVVVAYGGVSITQQVQPLFLLSFFNTCR